MILNLKNISKSFGDVSVLKNFNLQVFEGESVSIVGPSGSGKTTLLQIAGLIEKPDSGTVEINGTKIDNDLKIINTRRNILGFVYQFHHLLPEFSALENIIIPQKISGKVDIDFAKYLLQKVGLSGKFHRKPAELSGGECQRVAIARSLACKPGVILADEPTGNLDPERALLVFDLLINIAKEQKASIVMVTHNMEIASKTDRIVKINSPQVVEDILFPQLEK